MSKCFNCSQDLGKARKKYAWYLSIGFDPKDASAEILTNPDTKLPAKQCCITSLQTNISLEDHTEYENKIKERLDEKLKQKTGSLKQRDLFILYPVTPLGVGDFFLIDSSFSDPDLLSTKTNEKGRVGYDITNITKAPPSLLEKNGWQNENAVVLWFGTIKVVCLDIRRNPNSITEEKDLGLIKWVNVRTKEEGFLDPNNRSFLGARIIEYSIRPLKIQIPGYSEPQVAQPYAFTVEQLLPDENYNL